MLTVRITNNLMWNYSANDHKISTSHESTRYQIRFQNFLFPKRILTGIKQIRNGKPIPLSWASFATFPVDMFYLFSAQMDDHAEKPGRTGCIDINYDHIRPTAVQ